MAATWWRGVGLALLALAPTAAPTEPVGAAAEPEIIEPADIDRPPYIFSTVPTLYPQAQHRGEMIASGDLAWAHVATLTKPLEYQSGFYGHKERFAAGRVFYGVYLVGPSMGAGFSWCTPALDSNASTWRALCLFPSIYGGYTMLRPLDAAFTLTGVGMSKYLAPNIKVAEFKRQAADMGVRVRVEYYVHKFSKRTLTLGQRLIPDRGAPLISDYFLTAPIGSDGAAYVLIGGAVLRISRVEPDSFAISTLRPPTAGMPIMALAMRQEAPAR